MKTKIVKPLASIKLAVLVILALGLLTAIGTIVESNYDTQTAQKLVYHSPYMVATLLLLAVNLIAVMVDRWPWKRKHSGFVLAHIGILVLLVGSFVSKNWGVDGTLRLEPGGAARGLITPEMELAVYASFDGDRYRPLLAKPVDFIVSPPSERNKMFIEAAEGKIEIIDYKPYAIESRKIVASTRPQDGAAVRFQLQNERVQMVEWITQSRPTRPEIKDLGPAQIVLGSYTPNERNAIVMSPQDATHLRVSVFAKTGAKLSETVVAAGDVVTTPWMGLQLRLIDYLPKAQTEIKFEELEHPTTGSTSAVKVRYQGEEHWLGAGTVLKFFRNDVVYVLAYRNRLLDLGFDLTLVNFKIGRYPGTQKAASYESQVRLPDGQERNISMNEPLTHAGYTFYQASFEENEKGEPAASILSVNYDPGRWLKYLGCFFIVMGTVLMFYFKRRKPTASPVAVSSQNQGSNTFASGLVTQFLFLLISFILLGLTPQTQADGSFFNGGENNLAQLGRTLAELPVQDGGRIKPFDTFARESMQLLHGRQKYAGHESSEMIFMMMVLAQHWDEQEFIEINFAPLKKALKLDAARKYFSPQEILGSPRLALVMGELTSKRQSRAKLNLYDQAAQRLDNQIELYSRIRNGQYPRLAPRPPGVNDFWLTPRELPEPLASQLTLVASGFAGAAGAAVESNSSRPDDQTQPASLVSAIDRFKQLARAQNPEVYPQTKKIELEVYYNRLAPFQKSWLLYLTSVLLLALSFLRSAGRWSRGCTVLAWASLLAAFALHAYGFALRIYLTERAPVSNMYESVVWVSFGCILFALIFTGVFGSRFFSSRLLLLGSASVATLCLVLADLAPTILDPTLAPLEPVLRSNYWLVIHVMTITLSYAAFFLALAMGNATLVYFLRGEVIHRQRIQELSQINYRILQVGVVLLAAGTILGGVWADYSWGRFWGWDPKEVWAFVALMGYLALLHARLAGWARDLGLAAGSVLAFALVIMAWYGVNFILGAGLHSYGFGAGGLSFVAPFVLLHFLFVGFVVTYVRVNRRALSA